MSLDCEVKAANSETQRAAENFFYTDTQINWDFEKFTSDWLNNVNPRTGVAFEDEAVLSIVETGNELWTAALDAPTWTPGEGLPHHVDRPHHPGHGGRHQRAARAVHGLGLGRRRHPRHPPLHDLHRRRPARHGPVRRLEGQVVHRGRVPLVQAHSPALEEAVRETTNIPISPLWSLQNDTDLHNNGALYGGDDLSALTRAAERTRRRPPPGNLSLIGARSASSDACTGDLAEIIFYDRILSASERASVTTYLGQKYAITVS